MKVPYFEFKGLHGRRAECGLEIHYLADGRVLVIAIEISGNPGASVTNAAELLAEQVCRTFSIFPAKLVWAEHYGYGTPGVTRGFDLVTFNLYTSRAYLREPSWRPMRDEDWRALGLEPRESVTYEPTRAAKGGVH